jgi:hypothetical protein
MSPNPPKLAFDLERDLRALSAMASNLTPYLYEEEMYGHLAGDLPKLTLGGLLLRLHRLSALEESLNTDRQNIVQNARLNFEAEIAQWAVHYENKLERELTVRTRDLARFIQEAHENPTRAAAEYPVQAEKRTIIDLLLQEAVERDLRLEEVNATLKQTDQHLKQLLHEGEFISDEQLAHIYPRSQYWWLYGYLTDAGRG